MYFVFIVNPIAGEKGKQKLIKRMESAIRMSDHFFIKEDTKAVGHAKQIAKKYAEKYGEECVIVSCGGDGTIHEIVNGISGTKAKMIVLPMGTGNDFAKTVYNTKKPDIEVIMKRFGLLDGKISFNVRPIDAIDVNGNKCINVLSFGHDTRIETVGRKIVKKIPALGKNSYNCAAAYCCLFNNMKYKLDIDFTTVEEDGSTGRICEKIDYTLMAICNASFYGGGYCPSPNAVLDDGVIELCWIDAVNVLQAAPVIPMYARGEAAKSKRVHTASLTSGTVKTLDGSALPVNYDGENFTAHVVNFHVEKQAINLCIPVEE